MNYGAINKLVDKVDGFLKSFKDFSNSDSKTLNVQTGVMRTNCIQRLF
jgi:Na+-transporting NADH:ubiquinone oxidoreductase subunit NqrD